MKKIIAGAIALLLSTSSVEAGNAEALVISAAKRHGVPVSLAMSIARYESRVECGVWGDHGTSGGPLQVHYPTARLLYGVRSFKQFRSLGCAQLTEMGMKHLSMCWKKAKGNSRAAARCHNGGPGATWSKRKKVNRYASTVLGKF